MSYGLVQKFAEYEVPAEMKSAHKAGMQLPGSLAFMKIIGFAYENNVNNIDIDYFMSLRPTRQEDETPEDFKNRSKLSKLLYKFRPYLYDYSVYEKQ
jgi:hypothetical protein